MGKLFDARVVAHHSKQSSLLHAGVEDVSFAAFYSMKTAFSHPEG